MILPLLRPDKLKKLSLKLTINSAFAINSYSISSIASENVDPAFNYHEDNTKEINSLHLDLNLQTDIFHEICETLKNFTLLESLIFEAPFISSMNLSSISNMVQFNKRLQFLSVQFIIHQLLQRTNDQQVFVSMEQAFESQTL